MRRITAICLAISLLGGCSGYWATESTYSSSVRTRPAVTTLGVEPEVLDLHINVFGFPEAFTVGMLATGCSTSWEDVVTTTRTERFRSTTNWKLWLTLGALTAGAGLINVAADSQPGLGYVLMAGGGVEMVYGMTGLFASVRRRTSSNTETVPGYAEVPCDQSIANATNYQLATPWGSKLTPVRWFNERFLAFSPDDMPLTNIDERLRQPFTLIHTPSGTSWTLYVNLAPLRDWLK